MTGAPCAPIQGTADGGAPAQMHDTTLTTNKQLTDPSGGSFGKIAGLPITAMALS